MSLGKIDRRKIAQYAKDMARFEESLHGRVSPDEMNRAVRFVLGDADVSIEDAVRAIGRKEIAGALRNLMRGAEPGTSIEEAATTYYNEMADWEDAEAQG